MWVSHTYPFLQVSFPPKPPQFLFYSSNPPPFPLFKGPSISVNPSIKASSQQFHTTSKNHVIQSLCRQGNLKQAIQVLTQEPNPSQRTYEALILTCTQQNATSYGSIVHRHLSIDGFDQDSFLCTKLVDMYSQFNSLDDARDVFEKTREKTIFLWNALLKALALANKGAEAISRCRQMGRLGISFDSFSYSYILKACVGPSSSHPIVVSRRVCEIHCHILRNGYQSRVHVATTLVDSYARLGRVSYARRVFDGMLERNIVSWSALISCYTNNERSFEALGIFCDMMAEAQQDIVPNSVTMVSVLQACAGLSALGLGKVVHAYVLRRGLDSIISVNNALIAMYIKCGAMETGLRVFDDMSNQRDVVSWNSIISGYGIHGFGKEAIQVFKEMISIGISPTFITFISILGACSHAGLVQEGKTLFDSMVREHGIIPRAEHYACMIDLLGRAGQLDEAAKIVEEMRIEPGPTVWGSLLGACRTRGHVELAERACARLFELEPENAGNYVLLADTYAEAKMWEEVSRVRKLMEAQSLQKVPGCCWIEVKRRVYSFASADEMNPQIEQIHAFLIHLVAEMKEIGYVPETKVVLYDLDEKEKEHILLGHSEKLAVAFGLINNSSGEAIRITKNLRLCEDCHTFTKLLSKFAKIEIFVRDVNRCHRFRDGTCSCQDYW